MSLRWDDLRLFVAVHEQGSLSGAARLLKLGQPTLSRRISELEAAIGEPLFERQSQGAVLTAAGRRLLPAAQSMAEWAREAELHVSSHPHLPQGKVRIAAPPGIALQLVAPLAAAFRRQYPQIQIEVLSGVEMLNLARGEADLALRTMRSQDDDLICLDELDSPMRAYASKAYVAGLPPRPGFVDLDWICWATPYDGLQINQELSARIPDFVPAFASDDYNVQLAACKAGLGAMILPRVLHQHAGLGLTDDLQEIDLDLGPGAVGSLYMVCHKRHRHLPKVQLVIDALSAEFARLRATMEEPKR